MNEFRPLLLQKDTKLFYLCEGQIARNRNDPDLAVDELEAILAERVE